MTSAAATAETVESGTRPHHETTTPPAVLPATTREDPSTFTVVDLAVAKDVVGEQPQEESTGIEADGEFELMDELVDEGPDSDDME